MFNGIKDTKLIYQLLNCGETCLERNALEVNNKI